MQAGFVSLDEDGAAVFDEGFGTVEKVSDSPLTVKYTIDPAATWSDGTAVTPADLLLEWAARSGQLDDVTPELDAQGGITNNDELDAGVAFAAASPALVQAQQVPTVDGATLTLVVRDARRRTGRSRSTSTSPRTWSGRPRWGSRTRRRPPRRSRRRSSTRTRRR